jgi:hypothetical protein
MRVRYKPISGFPNYRIGDDGSVWGNRRHKNAEWRRLRPTTNKRGYLFVTLYYAEGGRQHRKQMLVHCLVLLAFRGPCPAGEQSRHYPDPTRTNCRLRNLRYGTPAENQADRREHGTMLYDEKCHMSKLTEADVRVIW